MSGPGPQRGGPAKLPDLDALGVSYVQLDRWTRAGYLRPVNPDPGRSGRRIWPQEELDVAARMARLVKVGCSVKLAHVVARGKADVGLGVHITVDPAAQITEGP